MNKRALSILPSRRQTGPAFYEHPIWEPNRWQMRTAVRPFEIRRRKKAPLWLALLMLLSGVVGLIGLFITIWE